MRATLLGVGPLALAISGCAPEPQPRSFAEFMEDRVATEGTIERCDRDREGTANDIECANARRAQATIALRLEQERRIELERESERKLAELRAELARREHAEREALAAAEAARQAAYEALWAADPDPALDGGEATTDVDAATGLAADGDTPLPGPVQ